jgi:hypothetical protein
LTRRRWVADRHACSFELGSVPRQQAGMAGGSLITAQRIGAAIGIAAIGTALFGSGTDSSSADKAMPMLVTNAQRATLVNLGFIAAAFACALLLPKTLGSERAEENS